MTFDRKRYRAEHPIGARWYNRLYFALFRHHPRAVVEERLRVDVRSKLR